MDTRVMNIVRLIDRVNYMIYRLDDERSAKVNKVTDILRAQVLKLGSRPRNPNLPRDIYKLPDKGRFAR